MNCLAMVCLLLGCTSVLSGAETQVPVTFSSGHEIGAGDFGRPVTLIAAALKVKPEVFREAFSGVTPAKGRGPTGGEARKNKEALLKVLSPHGVTNERLDEVSDYYRYQPQRGELWPTTEAKGYAVVVDGKIQKVVVTQGGSGYSSQPSVKVKGFEKETFHVTLKHSTDFKQNGSVAEIVQSER